MPIAHVDNQEMIIFSPPKNRLDFWIRNLDEEFSDYRLYFQPVA